MTRFLANSFAGLLELLMWLFILLGIAGGLGSDFSEFVLLNGAVGFLIAAVLSALFFGPILMLIEIKNGVTNIEALLIQRNRIENQVTSQDIELGGDSFTATK